MADANKKTGRRFLSAVTGLLVLTLCSCAALEHRPPNGGEQTDSRRTREDIGEMLNKAGSEERVALDPDSLKASDIENFTIEEVIRIEEPNAQTAYDNSRYDFPITMNSKVEGWIDYFTGRGRQHMERYLGRSSRYIPMMKVALKRAGLPEDLVYLALIESGFNMRANSRARAVGPWQFIKATGKRYGLRVDAWIDERRDPIRSTEAAARYLKDLYLMFESWYLAASAYNAGEYKILRAIEQAKTNNFWSISNTRLIRRETKDYVPKLIAAAIIAKNPAKYGFQEVEYQEPLEFETVVIDFPIPLKEVAKLVDASEEEVEDLNPELRRGMVPPDSQPYELRVPVGSRVLVERAVAAIRTTIARSEMPMEYTVRRGDTLRSVANKYRLRYQDLAQANNLSPKETLPPGSTLLIPNRGSAQRVSENPRTAMRRNVSAKSTAGFTEHVVRRGESLWSISEKYDVTIQDIFKWNDLSKSKIMPGKRLRIKANANATPEDGSHEGHIVLKNRRRVS